MLLDWLLDRWYAWRPRRQRPAPNMRGFRFTIEACRSENGVPTAFIPLVGEFVQDVADDLLMRFVVEDALKALSLTMIAAHPTWEMSLEPSSWRVEPQPYDPVDFAARNNAVRDFVLVPLEGAITVGG